MTSATPARRLKICIVAHAAYGALTGGGRGHAGGVERQTSMLAHWLADHGHDVSFLTWDEGPRNSAALAGVRLVPLCAATAGLPGVRFFYPRWTSLIGALREADADIYYQNGAECVTGQVALWCRRNRRKFVYSAASDFDCDPRLPELKKLRERALYRHGLRLANRVIVQTQRQRDQMLRFFGRNPAVLAMPCPGPDANQFSSPPAPVGNERPILWVGRISTVKRLEVLVDVAALLPQFTFEVAGGADGDDPSISLAVARGEAARNVRMLGKVPRDKMAELYRGAALLCCTSATEGFPNTFLEAWSHAVPVVTTVDPDNLVNDRGLGRTGKDAESLAAAINKLMTSPELWLDCSRKARLYYLENHTVDRVMEMFEQLLLDTLGAAGAGEPGGEALQPREEGLSA